LFINNQNCKIVSKLASQFIFGVEKTKLVFTNIFFGSETTGIPLKNIKVPYFKEPDCAVDAILVH
jgi:hypothetical protein